MEQDRKKRINEKVSAGIACCRKTPNGFQVLTIRKRYTYAYNTFVNGRYKSDNSYEIINLFNNMTMAEKLDIASMNFVQIWYRIWLHNPQKTSSFYVAKNKFENTFAMDGGAYLRRLLIKSDTSVDLMWELPKGRKKNKMESDLQCGIREFGEETMISRKKYKVFDNFYKYSYISDNTRYTNIYYYAFARDMFEPRVYIGNNQQIGEVGDIKWMSLTELMCADTTGRMYPVVRKLFNFVKSRI
jgi:8-oxo-dGTP pyrophosphatase MutT (NUDIX family)